MIEFFNEDTDFVPQTPEVLKPWIERVIIEEGHQLGDINYIFCSNPYLLTLNSSYLNHHSYTDVIAFDQSTKPLTISGDIYISVDQVKINAIEYGQTFGQELKRVMVHGVLHLLGYKDKTPDEKQEMRKKEEAYLSLR